jgi:hypothetical protein
MLSGAGCRRPNWAGGVSWPNRKRDLPELLATEGGKQSHPGGDDADNPPVRANISDNVEHRQRAERAEKNSRQE